MTDFAYRFPFSPPRQVLGEDEELESDDLFSSSQGRWSQPSKGPFKVSIQRGDAARAAANGLLRIESSSSSSDHQQQHHHHRREPQDPPMVKLSLKQRLERAKHILAHDPDKAIRGNAALGG